MKAWIKAGQIGTSGQVSQDESVLPGGQQDREEEETMELFQSNTVVHKVSEGGHEDSVAANAAGRQDYADEQDVVVDMGHGGNAAVDPDESKLQPLEGTTESVLPGGLKNREEEENHGFVFQLNTAVHKGSN